MKNIPNLLLLFTLSLFLGSCECYPTSKGIVLDEKTHVPIENAQVVFGEAKCFTDANGEFNISASGCNLKITVKKNEYKTFGARLSNTDNKLTFQIDKEIMYQDLDQQEYLNSNNNKNTHIAVRSTVLNSIHFEYIGESEGLIIYLEQIE